MTNNVFLVVFSVYCMYNYKLSRGEICVANYKATLQMVQVWTGFMAASVQLVDSLMTCPVKILCVITKRCIKT